MDQTSVSLVNLEVFFALLILVCKSPLSQYSMTMQRHSELSSKNASLYWQILGCLMEARILTSLSAFSFSFADNFCIFTYFLSGISLEFRIIVSTYLFERVSLLVWFSQDFKYFRECSRTYGKIVVRVMMFGTNLPNLLKVTKSPIFVPESLIADIKIKLFLILNL